MQSPAPPNFVSERKERRQLASAWAWKAPEVNVETPRSTISTLASRGPSGCAADAKLTASGDEGLPPLLKLSADEFLNHVTNSKARAEAVSNGGSLNCISTGVAGPQFSVAGGVSDVSAPNGVSAPKAAGTSGASTPNVPATASGRLIATRSEMKPSAPTVTERPASFYAAPVGKVSPVMVCRPIRRALSPSRVAVRGASPIRTQGVSQMKVSSQPPPQQTPLPSTTELYVPWSSMGNNLMLETYAKAAPIGSQFAVPRGSAVTTSDIDSPTAKVRPLRHSRSSVVTSAEVESPPGKRLPLGQRLLGSWRYADTSQYTISSTSQGGTRFDEVHKSGRAVTGSMHVEAEWLQASLKFVDNEDPAGSMRLRISSTQSRGEMAVSNFRPPGEHEWGEDLLAYRVEEPKHQVLHVQSMSRLPIATSIRTSSPVRVRCPSPTRWAGQQSRFSPPADLIPAPLASSGDVAKQPMSPVKSLATAASWPQQHLKQPNFPTTTGPTASKPSGSTLIAGGSVAIGSAQIQRANVHPPNARTVTVTEPATVAAEATMALNKQAGQASNWEMRAQQAEAAAHAARAAAEAAAQAADAAERAARQARFEANSQNESPSQNRAPTTWVQQPAADHAPQGPVVTRSSVAGTAATPCAAQYFPLAMPSRSPLN